MMMSLEVPPVVKQGWMTGCFPFQNLSSGWCWLCSYKKTWEFPINYVMFTRGVLALTIPVLGTPPWGLSYPHPGIIGHVQVQPPKKYPLTLHNHPNIYIYTRYIHIYIWHIPLLVVSSVFIVHPTWDNDPFYILMELNTIHVFGMDWESPKGPHKSKGWSSSPLFHGHNMDAHPQVLESAGHGHEVEVRRQPWPEWRVRIKAILAQNINIYLSHPFLSIFVWVAFQPSRTKQVLICIDMFNIALGKSEWSSKTGEISWDFTEENPRFREKPPYLFDRECSAWM
jgi:hypothetical protein